MSIKAHKVGRLASGKLSMKHTRIIVTHYGGPDALQTLKKCPKPKDSVSLEESTVVGTVGAIWGLAGVFLLLGSAVYRLSVVAASAFADTLQPRHWAALLVAVLFMAYAEGYRAFQQRFSPRVAARAKYLRNHPRIFHIAFAPLFCMGFFYATRKRKITAISVTTGIVLLIVLVRLLPQPWRGIIDLSVVVGLGWGIVSLAFFGYQAFASEEFNYPPDVPEIK